MLRWRAIRRTHQVFFFLLFVALLYASSYGQIRAFPVSLFLEADPLLALASALSSGVVFGSLWLSLIVVLLTVVFGRVFCSFACPLGILNHVFSYRRDLTYRAKLAANRWRPAYKLKYYVLLTVLTLSAFGVQQAGLIDPISLVTRSFALLVFPGLQLAGVPIYAAQPTSHGGWLIGLLFLAILAANRFVPRLWCRLLCPLGALLGLIGKYSLFRIHRDANACVACGRCASDCAGACEPDGDFRASDCLMCLNCVDSCSRSGITYRFLPDTSREAVAPDLSRRTAALAVVSGVALVPTLRVSQGVLAGAQHDAVRPPGSLVERDFAAKCIKCGACMRACPTGVLQPAALEVGFEGLWTPILQFDVGFCQHDCTLCSQVCPTGAIRPLTPAQRIGLDKLPVRKAPEPALKLPARGAKPTSGAPVTVKPGTPATKTTVTTAAPASAQTKAGEQKKLTPIKIGTAFIDRGRCLPWGMATPCIVCEEVCPTSPKAIWIEEVRVPTRDGKTLELKRPHVEPSRCIGCGTCQYRCPVGAKAAIRVSSVGETRSPQNKVLLGGY